MAPDCTILAIQFKDPGDNIVQSAALLADEMLRQLTAHTRVVVDLHGLRGLSSSYFNILLQRVSPVTTLSGFGQRVQMRFDSPAQEQVFNRSLDFATRTVA